MVKKRNADSISQPERGQEDEANASQQANSKKKKKSATTHLSTIWYEWHTREPWIWNSGASYQHVSDSRHTVAFMKLFLDGGFKLDDGATDFKEVTHAYGLQAKVSIIDFLHRPGVRAYGAGSILKHMRAARQDGALDVRIRSYQTLRVTGAAEDSSPQQSQDIIKIASEV